MNPLFRWIAALVVVSGVAAATSAAVEAADTNAVVTSARSGAPVAAAARVDLSEAGLTLTLPDRWQATRERSQVYLMPDDQSLAMVIGIADEAGLDALVGAIRSNQNATLSDVRVTRTEDGEVNGMRITTESGTARGTDGPAVWSLRVVRASRPVVVYTLASPQGLRMHERDCASLLGSLRKYEGTP